MVGAMRDVRAGRELPPGAVPQAAPAPQTIAVLLQNFEGLSNQDNLDIFGFRANPPDPGRRCRLEPLR